jgi:hypothetical protein
MRLQNRMKELLASRSPANPALNVAHATSNSDARIIVVTMAGCLFDHYFAPLINQRIFLFSRIDKALSLWRLSPASVLFADYATLADGQSGFTLVKTVRAEEAGGVGFKSAQNSTPVYLMADSPQINEDQWTRKLGGQGVIRKTPAAVAEVIDACSTFLISTE